MADKVAEALYKGTRREGFGRNRGHIGAFGEFTEGVLTDKANLVAQALMAPGNALQGQYNELEVLPSGAVSQMDPRLMQQATNMAGMVSLGSIAAPKPSGALTAGFSDWFGGSRVVDEAGAPLTVYHGTTSPSIEAFDPAKMGRNDPGFYGKGFYFTPIKGLAEQYASRDGSIHSVNLAVKKPFVWDVSTPELAEDTLKRARQIFPKLEMNGASIHPGRIQQWTDALKAEGYDGVFVETKGQGSTTPMEVVAFKPTQIKSATGNSGEYNPADPNIYRAGGIPIVAEDKRNRR